MTKLIIVNNPCDELIDLLIGMTPCVYNDSDLILPYDMLEELHTIEETYFAIDFKIIEY